MKRETVLVVDNESSVLDAASDALSDRFNVVTAESGNAGVRKAIEVRPDFILLDTEMPDMSGYEACEILKCEPLTHRTPIVFISDGDRVSDRKLGYELGAEEFIPKPFDADELLQRLEMLSKRMRQNQDLSARVEKATQTAMTAVAGINELGTAIQFVEASYTVSSLEELAQQLLQATDAFGLSCGLMVATSDGLRFFASRGMLKPMEEDLMKALHAQSERIHDFGSRTQINLPHTALLVKNMPTDEPERNGRLKDLFPVLLGALEARVRNIETEHALVLQTQNLISSFKIMESTLQGQSDGLRDSHAMVSKVVESLWKNVEEKIPNLGLDEDQEQFFMNHIETALDETHDVLRGVEILQTSFASVMRLFGYLTEQQQTIFDDYIKKNPQHH